MFWGHLVKNPEKKNTDFHFTPYIRIKSHMLYVKNIKT